MYGKIPLNHRGRENRRIILGFNRSRFNSPFSCWTIFINGELMIIITADQFLDNIMTNHIKNCFEC